MSEPEVLWRLGHWLAEGGTGRLHLAWSTGELRLTVRGGAITDIEGIEPAAVATRLGVPPAGLRDPYEEAHAIATRHGLPEAQALAAVKAELEGALRSWLADPDRRLVVTAADVPPPAGAAISLPHVLVELLLSPSGAELARRALPDLDVVLRRRAAFLDRYARLRLSQDADLIAAKITGSRTAREIVERSPHAEEQVVALLAALVLAGLVEPVPVAAPPAGPELELAEPSPPPAPERPPRRAPPVWLAVAAVVALLLVVGIVLLGRGHRPADGQTRWGIVVDSGCQAIDHERMLRKESRFGGAARILAASEASQDPCRQLVWGAFSTRESAEGAIPRLPRGLVSEGFEPHVIPLPEDRGEP